MENNEFAKIFFEISELLELKGENVFKMRAYQKAARNIDNLPKNLEEIYQAGGIKELKEVPGIGESIAEHIEEIIKTGSFKKYRDLLKEFPKDFVKLIEIPGVGPKTAIMLLKKLKIDSMKKLEAAAKAGKLRELQGMGLKKEKNILKGIELKKRSHGRFLLPEAQAYADLIVKALSKVKGVEKTIPAGSLRRSQETIGDIDVLVISKDPESAMKAFTSLPQVSRVLAKGPTKASVLLSNEMQADIRVLEPKSFGAALHYFTGNKQHNIRMRELMIKKGLKLNEYGVFRGNKYICGKTEEEIFKAVGLPFIEPELRQGTDELEAARKNILPKLVELEDIRGDLQMHSKHSDGGNTIEEMAEYAKKLGYSYIAITDHTLSTRIARGLSEKQFFKELEEIEKINSKLKGFRVLKGIEVDILPDGSLDYSDAALKECEVVVAAIHSGFKMEKEKMTARIIAAMKNKYVNLISHPTGRLIGKRDPYEVDMEEIIKAAAGTGTYLELNAQPERLDLNDVHCRMAKEAGIMISIDTDAHAKENLEFMKYGVGTARRGWLEAKDILNTRPVDKLLKYLSAKRR